MGRRRSGRLEQVEVPETYREARVRAQNGAGAEVARGQREAAAVWSTRGDAAVAMDGERGR